MQLTATNMGLSGADWFCRKLGGTALACLLLGFAATSEARYGARVHESVEISDFYAFNTDVKTEGATILVRDFKRRTVDVDLYANDLQPGWAYSIWIAVFNNPEFCSEPCGVDDLPGPNPDADPRVRPSVFYGGGLLADGTGHGSASFGIPIGRTQRELFGGTMNYGLQHLYKAHIHVVLRSHGEALVGGIAEQIGTASMTCNTAEGCQNVIASFHPPLEME